MKENEINLSTTDDSLVSLFRNLIEFSMADKKHVKHYGTATSLVKKFDSDIFNGKPSTINDLNVGWLYKFSYYLTNDLGYSPTYVNKVFVRVRSMLRILVGKGYNIDSRIFLMNNPVKLNY